MASDTGAVEVRRENLRRLIKDKFDNRRAAFARTADIQPNQVNLMLSPNPDYQRPVTEDMARRIERNLSLPSGFMDRHPDDNAPPGLKLIRSMEVPAELRPVLATSSSLGSITVTQEWLTRHHVLNPASLWLVEVACDGMDPDVKPGDLMVIELLDEELPPQRAFSTDGTYILVPRTGPMLRRLQRTVSGFVISSPNRMYSREESKDLRSIKLLARMVAKLTIS
jgi:hypothetical protein